MSKTAEVAGGGIAGLAISTMLAKRGWSVRVHEQSSEIREIGAGIFLKNNSISVLEPLGVMDYLEKEGVWLQRAEIWDERGSQLQRRQLKNHSRVIDVPRQSLIQALERAAREAGVQIETGSMAVGGDPAGELIMRDGRRLSADLVVAADGHGSLVRNSLGLTQRHVMLKTMSMRYLVPSREPSPEPITREFWSGRRRIGIAACTADSTYIYMACPVDDQEGIELPLNVGSWSDSFPTLRRTFETLAELECTQHPYAYAACKKWSAGKVAIIGDAANALPPTLGQGSSLAIMNATTLSEAVDHYHGPIQAALESWERRYRYITDQTQRWALRYDRLTANWPPSLATARAGIIWTFGKSNFLNSKLRIADRGVKAVVAG